MFIHTVAPGESVFAVARRYGASPMKLMQDNNLETPDLLLSGEELLVLLPTRTYTVKGGDTLPKIARKFGVRAGVLRAGNPALAGGDTLYPGEVLAVKYAPPPCGMVAANGYGDKDTDRAALLRALPYLTYMTFRGEMREGAACAEGDGVFKALGREAGKTLLLELTFSDIPSAPDAFAEGLAREIRALGYQGVTLTFCKMPDGAALGGFLAAVRRKFLGSDLLVFLSWDAMWQALPPDLSDGVILLCDKAKDAPGLSFNEGERAALLRFSEEAESAKATLFLPTAVHDGDALLSFEAARRTAVRYRKEIVTDGETLLASFRYRRFERGKREERQAVFDSLRLTKEKLTLADEFGFMGVAFDLSTVRVPVLMLFHTMFSEADFAFLQSGDGFGD